MKLDQYLRQYKVTATDFAIVLGVHVSQVSRWASGERVPSLTQAAAIRTQPEAELPTTIS